jgi:hypothetical protein
VPRLVPTRWVCLGRGPGDPSVARVPGVLSGTLADMGELLNLLRDDREVIM